MGSGVTMTMSPGTPFAGMDIAFEIKGLRPSQWIEVTFIDPAGQESRWVTDEDARGTWTTQYLRADSKGQSGWVRYGTQDHPGRWSVRIKHGDAPAVVNYNVDPMRPSRRHRIELGVPLTGCRSEQAEIFFSDSVHFAMTVGMHRQLDSAIQVLDNRLGVRSSRFPAIHLLGSKAELDQAERATGGTPGWEAGFFRSWGDNPGIYMHTDHSLTDIYNTLTHEYVHFVMYEVANGKTLPAWLSEGLAGYYEFEVGLFSERPQATVWRMLGSADRAQEAAAAGNLFTLDELESRRLWNSRPAGERVSLQYSQAYMLARYVAETFGAPALLEMAKSIGQGADVSSAVLALHRRGLPAVGAGLRNLAAWMGRSRSCRGAPIRSTRGPGDGRAQRYSRSPECIGKRMEPQVRPGRFGTGYGAFGGRDGTPAAPVGRSAGTGFPG